VIVSAVGYFFSIIAIFTTIVAFMTLLIGGFNPLTLEKVRHYPHPRPNIEQTVTPINPEPHHVRVAPGTNEATPATDLSAQYKSTKDAPPLSQKQTPRTASLSEKSSAKGLRIFTNPNSCHVSSRTMRDTATG
jgi:energy-converting hydrogenase Eha subunit F